MQTVFMPAENITSLIQKPKTLLPWVNEFTTLKKKKSIGSPYIVEVLHVIYTQTKINKQTKRKKKQENLGKKNKQQKHPVQLDLS